MTLLHQFFQFPVCFCTFALYVSLTFCVLSHVYLGTHHDTSCGRLCRKNKYKHWLSCCFILLYHHHILSKIIAQVAAKLVLVSFLVICLKPYFSWRNMYTIINKNETEAFVWHSGHHNREFFVAMSRWAKHHTVKHAITQYVVWFDMLTE